MSKYSHLFEDFTKLAGSFMDTAFHSLADVRNHFDRFVDGIVDAVLKRKQLVSREEFDVVKTMLAQSRQEQEQLKKRLDALEKTQHSHHDA